MESKLKASNIEDIDHIKEKVNIGENFWKDRKENFVKLKIWEDTRNSVNHHLATLVIGMLGILM
jgi:hypothetical protein